MLQQQLRVLMSRVAIVGICIAAVPASAAGFGYVSVSGSDANPCSLVQPCRTIFHAAQVIASQGTITMLDDGDYTGASLSGNLTIQGQGPGSVIANPNAIGLDFSGGSNIVLRNLSIEALPGSAGQIGIQFGGTSLDVENVSIRRQTAQSFTSWGIAVTSSPNQMVHLKNVHIGQTGQGAATGGAMWIRFGGGSPKVSVENSSFENNSRGIIVDGFNSANVQLALRNTTISGSAGYGVFFNPSAGTHKIEINDSQIVNNGATGVYVAPTGSAKVDVTVNASSLGNNANIGIAGLPGGSSSIAVSIADTSVSGNAWGGIYASGKSNFGIIRANIASNGYGINAASPATVRVGSSMINGNYLGLSGPISSYGNNQLLGNTTQGSATTVPPAGRP